MYARLHIRRSDALPSISAILALALAAAPTPALANNYAESLAWQFATPADIAAQAALRGLIERRRGGAYSTPAYTTNIARQVNCSVAASATGNSGLQSATANSPAVSGASATAIGNSNASGVTGDHSNPAVTNGQDNAGTVRSSLTGATMTRVDGAATQALNSTQSNGGSQSANVSGSSACAFGVLN